MNANIAKLTLFAALGLPLAACAPEIDRPATVDAPAVRVVGAAESCITTSQIRNTKVHDDYTIDFEMNGGRTYRNTLPGRCGSLGFEERFAYQTTVGRLCNTDTITVLDSSGRSGITCGLGEFVPVEPVGDPSG